MRRYIKENLSTRVPTNLIISACETVTEVNKEGYLALHTLAKVSMIHLRRERGTWCKRTEVTVDTSSAAWEWLQSYVHPHMSVTMICDNAMRFATLTGLWGKIDKGEWSFKWCITCGNPAYADECCGKKVWRGWYVINDPPNIIRVRNTFGILAILDIRNYWPQFNAGVDDAEHTAMSVERIITRAMDQWDKADCGVWQHSSAALAYTSWRHVAPKRQIVRDDDEHQLAIARRGYYSGQCEAYFVGEIKGPIYKVDARSFYASRMIGKEYPCIFVGWSGEISPTQLAERAKQFLPIADVTINTSKYTYPVHRDGKLLFAHGRFATTLCWPELRVAIERGDVAYVHKVAWFHPNKPFDLWVNKWWKLRQKAIKQKDEQGAMLCKLILASLSGKLGAWSSRWKDCEKHNPPARFCQWLQRNASAKEDQGLGQVKSIQMRSVAGWCQYMAEPQEGRDSLPAIAAYITSYGRDYMNSLKDVLPEGTCIYQDTDALLVTEIGWRRLCRLGLIEENGLGAMHVEYIAEQCHIHATKMYELDDKLVAAGVKKDAIREGPSLFRQSDIQRLPAILARTPTESYVERMVRVHTPNTAAPRIAAIDGWTHAPYLTE